MPSTTGIEIAGVPGLPDGDLQVLDG